MFYYIVLTLNLYKFNYTGIHYMQIREIAKKCNLSVPTFNNKDMKIQANPFTSVRQQKNELSIPFDFPKDAIRILM